MSANAQPKRWKMIFISWLFVYPVVNVMFALLFPLLSDLPQLAKTLVFTLILVPLMGGGTAQVASALLGLDYEVNSTRQIGNGG
ncbi:hypothetical protein OAV84_02430 [Schleiferiaceae bacterium]|jgi:antibiotic biosynthesis monooxygenase (ABM) superfamily enzyme|nr:hypothetical protein [Schleiferiaceae bacterium]